MYNLSKLHPELGIIFALITESVICFPVDGWILHLQNRMPFPKTIVPDSVVSVLLQGVAERIRKVKIFCKARCLNQRITIRKIIEETNFL